MRWISAAALMLAALPALAQEEAGQAGHNAGHGGMGHGAAPAEDAAGHGVAPSPYVGEEAREVAGLSPEDLAALKAGQGWGLALPAELNGVPGPTHVLELSRELGLSADQVAAIEVVRDAMRDEAVAAGEWLIAAEAALDHAFREGGLDKARLAALVAQAEAARAELRLVHLSRHLETPALLTPDQVARYAELRGYGLREHETHAP